MKVMENQTYEKFIQDNEKKIADWIHPKWEKLELKKLRKKFLIDERRKFFLNSSMLPSISYSFLNHAEHLELDPPDTPKTNNNSTIIRKMTKNDIPVLYSKEIEDARNWAIYHIIQAQHQSKFEWLFSLAVSPESWTIFAIRNGECMRKDFDISIPNARELFIHEALVRELLIMVGYDCTIEYYHLEGCVFAKPTKEELQKLKKKRTKKLEK